MPRSLICRENILAYANRFYHDPSAAYESETINDQDLTYFNERVLAFACRGSTVMLYRRSAPVCSITICRLDARGSKMRHVPYQFVFQKDEVLKNSFDIFIKTPDYVAAMESIDVLPAGMKQTLTNNTEIEQTISDFKELRDAFGKSKPAAFRKTARFIRLSEPAIKPRIFRRR